MEVDLKVAEVPHSVAHGYLEVHAHVHVLADSRERYRRLVPANGTDGWDQDLVQRLILRTMREVCDHKVNNGETVNRLRHLSQSRWIKGEEVAREEGRLEAVGPGEVRARLQKDVRTHVVGHAGKHAVGRRNPGGEAEAHPAGVAAGVDADAGDYARLHRQETEAIELRQPVWVVQLRQPRHGEPGSSEELLKSDVPDVVSGVEGEPTVHAAQELVGLTHWTQHEGLGQPHVAAPVCNR
mmetsp:Transcript_37890/g.102587  ORF Transcript_37890/g.102587 Transcript_37890/m.102587 type:complete len:239 (+) Transcript_37890:388-1104(+)